MLLVAKCPWNSPEFAALLNLLHQFAIWGGPGCFSGLKELEIFVYQSNICWPKNVRFCFQMRRICILDRQLLWRIGWGCCRRRCWWVRCHASRCRLNCWVGRHSIWLSSGVGWYSSWFSWRVWCKRTRRIWLSTRWCSRIRSRLVCRENLHKFLIIHFITSEMFHNASLSEVLLASVIYSVPSNALHVHAPL